MEKLTTEQYEIVEGYARQTYKLCKMIDAKQTKLAKINSDRENIAEQITSLQEKDEELRKELINVTAGAAELKEQINQMNEFCQKIAGANIEDLVEVSIKVSATGKNMVTFSPKVADEVEGAVEVKSEPDPAEAEAIKEILPPTTPNTEAVEEKPLPEFNQPLDEIPFDSEEEAIEAEKAMDAALAAEAEAGMLDGMPEF